MKETLITCEHFQEGPSSSLCCLHCKSIRINTWYYWSASSILIYMILCNRLEARQPTLALDPRWIRSVVVVLHRVASSFDCRTQALALCICKLGPKRNKTTKNIKWGKSL